jgi:hypothetical protein
MASEADLALHGLERTLDAGVHEAHEEIAHPEHRSTAEVATEMGATVSTTDPTFGAKDFIQKASTAEAGGAGIVGGAAARVYTRLQETDLSKRARSSDVVKRINAGSRRVDGFFTRIKDNSVNWVKGKYNWVKGKITGDGADNAASETASNTAQQTASNATQQTATNTAQQTAANTGEKLAETTGEKLAEATAEEIAKQGAESGTNAALNSAGAALPGAAGEVTKDSVGFFGKAFGVLGKVGSIVAIPLTLAVGAFQTKHRIDAKDGHGAAKAAGSTVGGILGGVATGALEGLVIGGILGIEVPIIGSIVLGVAGAIIGGWLGSKAADKAVGKAWDKKLHEHDAKSPSPVVVVETAPPLEAQNQPDSLSKNHAAKVLERRQLQAQRTGIAS